jgi:predicted ATPase
VLTVLSIANYRSLLDLVVPLGPVNLVTGPNGSGKSNLYRALRLLAQTARDGVVNALAREGGLQSTFWAGPESLTRAMRRGDAPIQGSRRSEPVRLRLGFADDEFGYAVSLGLPPQSQSAFSLDPEIKRECIWAGPIYRPASLLVDRKGSLVRVRRGKDWRVVSQPLGSFDSLFSQLADPEATPEVFRIRESVRAWRFYDHFRTDVAAPARQPQLGTRTPVLHHDGRDLAAALQTIREIGDGDMLNQAVADAFPGAVVQVITGPDGRFTLEFHQEGLLRPLAAAELSDGTLRYLLWIAALLTPRPPPLMILNEPETSLHPDLLPALGRLVIEASKRSQVWVVSHAARLARVLEEHPECRSIPLQKEMGATRMEGLAPLDAPPWKWPEE